MSRNDVKESIKLELLKNFSSEEVAKGIRRLERWMRAAYGHVDYTEYVGQDVYPGEAAKNAAFYCQEVRDGKHKTFNRETFGIYGTGRHKK